MSDDRLIHFDLLEEFHLGEGHDQGAHGNRPVAAAATAQQRKADLVAHVRALPSRLNTGSGLCRLPGGSEVSMSADECAKRHGHWTAERMYFGWGLGRPPINNEENPLHEGTETAAQEAAEESGGVSAPTPAPAPAVPKPVSVPPPATSTGVGGVAGLPAPGVGAPAAAPSAGAPAGAAGQ